MAFGSWEAFENIAQGKFAIEAGQAIEGSQSVLIGQTGPNESYVQVVAKDASGLTKGVTAGRMRTLVDKKTISTVSAGFGLYCMASANNIVTSGACYKFRVKDDGTITIRKVTSGGLEDDGAILASGTTSPVPADDEVFAIELMWFFDALEFGGTKLEARYDTSGAVTDFTGLPVAPDLAVIDSATALSTSFAEGPYFEDLGSGANIEILFDLTTLYTVAFV